MLHRYARLYPRRLITRVRQSDHICFGFEMSGSLLAYSGVVSKVHCDSRGQALSDRLF